MKRHVLGLCLVVALALPGAASESEIRGVISGQVEAMRVDDFATAFGHASPTIRRLFGSPEGFERMVRRGYPMVHRPRELRFLNLREEGGRLWQRVLMVDEHGRSHLLDYQMIETPDGWQIDGVQLLRDTGVGA